MYRLQHIYLMNYKWNNSTKKKDAGMDGISRMINNNVNAGIHNYDDDDDFFIATNSQMNLMFLLSTGNGKPSVTNTSGNHMTLLHEKRQYQNQYKIFDFHHHSTI